MELKDLICEPPNVILKQEATAMDAIAAIVENEVTSVVINRMDSEDAFGIITTKDIIRNVIAKGLDPNEVEVTDICSKPLISVNNIELDIRWVAKKMMYENVSRIAVFEKEDLRCLISDIDILKALATEMKKSTSKRKKG